MTDKDFMRQEELRALQVTRLQDVLKRVYDNVGFFRKRFEDMSFRPENIKSPEDIKSLPFTVKTDLLDNYPYGFLAVPLEEVVRLDAVTTDKPLLTAYTREDIAMWSTAVKRCLLASGIGKADIIQDLYSRGGRGVHYGTEALGAAVVSSFAGSAKAWIKRMQELGVTAVCCTPSYFNLIVEQAGEMGIDLRRLPLKTGIFGSELWTEEMRSRIEESSGIKAYDIYGLAEIINPGVAVECECRNGLHILEDLFYPEIINPGSGEPLPEGETGELVLTTLVSRAMPLIRYRTGDITGIMPGKCECGRTLRRIERISTRREDMITVQGINISPSRIEAALLSIKGTLPHYNIILYSENGMDGIEINVEITEAIFSDKIRSLEAFQRSLADAVEEVLGLRVKLKLVAPGSIQRSEGKARRVIDHRNK
ncbi:MAG: phenylacetate--CoA ligase [Victivallaceae bacterium]|nr:phenylacetate--CoA ligase [Victivallaceae bacterium]